ncbi:hypothetical protein LENED_009988 [Lentinula edodes]|uniref:Uncharacterized protein n=1 Tax=Lentinula edodes TaxID=5353 RepID=A0A1Q3EL62_LENED|nr:hypothetical protein LENED_009988 [Lentinula edodes]
MEMNLSSAYEPNKKSPETKTSHLAFSRIVACFAIRGSMRIHALFCFILLHHVSFISRFPLRIANFRNFRGKSSHRSCRNSGVRTVTSPTHFAVSSSSNFDESEVSAKEEDEEEGLGSRGASKGAYFWISDATAMKVTLSSVSILPRHCSAESRLSSSRVDEKHSGFVLRASRRRKACLSTWLWGSGANGIVWFN